MLLATTKKPIAFFRSSAVRNSTVISESATGTIIAAPMPRKARAAIRVPAESAKRTGQRGRAEQSERDRDDLAPAVPVAEQDRPAAAAPRVRGCSCWPSTAAGWWSASRSLASVGSATLSTVVSRPSTRTGEAERDEYSEAAGAGQRQPFGVGG